jgi:hypothetical protein
MPDVPPSKKAPALKRGDHRGSERKRLGFHLRGVLTIRISECVTADLERLRRSKRTHRDQHQDDGEDENDAGAHGALLGPESLSDKNPVQSSKVSRSQQITSQWKRIALPVQQPLPLPQLTRYA